MIGEINPKLQTQVKGETVTAKSSLLLRSASHPGQGHSLTFPALPCPALGVCRLRCSPSLCSRVQTPPFLFFHVIFP